MADPGIPDTLTQLCASGDEDRKQTGPRGTATQGDDALTLYPPAHEEVVSHSSTSSTEGERRPSGLVLIRAS